MTYSVAMLPVAPGLFSTTNWWPSFADRSLPQIATDGLERHLRPILSTRPARRERMRQLDAERNVLRQRGKQFAQRQRAFARHLAPTHSELAEQRGVRLARFEHPVGDLRIGEILRGQRLPLGRRAAGARGGVGGRR